MTEKGDFYALMFFVLALGNLIAYAALGWFANLVSHVRTKISLHVSLLPNYIFNYRCRQFFNHTDKNCLTTLYAKTCSFLTYQSIPLVV
jgi:hypothetical protein